MIRFARRVGSPALSRVCVIALGWPHAVRTSLYRALYPLVEIDQAALAAPPAQLIPLGYQVDSPADLELFRAAAGPAAGIADDLLRMRTLSDVIYRYHPGR